ncbi:MAG: hypothetical protein ACHQ52_01490 [Candidatus Eisenbacteria bacterium]
MRRPSPRRSAMVAFLLLAVASANAKASTDPLQPKAVPSAANSTVDANLALCPVGHLSFNVVVRDAASNPIQNSTVVVDFCSAPTVDICSTPSCTFTGYTNATGVVVLNIAGGGTSAAALASIRADGVPLAQRAVASTDQNGDLVVTPADLAAIDALLGTTDKRGDLDGDGVVTAADVNILQAHMGHACGGPVHSRDHSWGVLKIRYH